MARFILANDVTAITGPPSGFMIEMISMSSMGEPSMTYVNSAASLGILEDCLCRILHVLVYQGQGILVSSAKHLACPSHRRTLNLHLIMM